MKSELFESTLPHAASVSSWTDRRAPRQARIPRVERPRAARVAVSALFFLNGALFATWVARIPSLQAQRGLSHSALGLALLAMAFGAVIAMPLAGRLISTHGSEKTCRVAALLYCAFLPLLAAVPGTHVFFASLVLFGAAHGALDVAMNAHAVAVEERYRVPIMASFHALFSTGGLAGAAAGGSLAALGLSSLVHFSICAVVFAATARAVSSRLLKTTDQMSHDRSHPRSQQSKQSFALRVPGLAALGVVAACIMMGEGAIADWGAVYLRSIRFTSESVAATGYAAFSVAMAAGRFGGDALTSRLGAVRVVRLGGMLAAIGLSFALLVPGTAATLLGLACVGLGFSGIVPLVFSAAGRTAGIEPGVALATVTTMGYAGFLIGPPLIGFASEWIGLPGALGLIVATSLLSVALARAVRPRPIDRPMRAP